MTGAATNDCTASAPVGGFCNWTRWSGKALLGECEAKHHRQCSMERDVAQHAAAGRAAAHANGPALDDQHVSVIYCGHNRSGHD
jgi:hypothetical protein